MNEERPLAAPDSDLADVPVNNPAYVRILKVDDVADNQYPLLVEDQKLECIEEEIGYVSPLHRQSPYESESVILRISKSKCGASRQKRTSGVKGSNILTGSTDM